MPGSSVVRPAVHSVPPRILRIALAVLAAGGISTGPLQAQLVGPAPPAVQFDPRIVTVAGNGGSVQYGGDGGPAQSASMYNPQGMALDKLGNLYIADTYNSVVRRIDAQTQIITTVAGQNYPLVGNPVTYSGDGGPATSARMLFPAAVALDSAGNLYISDSANNVIRRVDAVTQIITTVAGIFHPPTSPGVAAPGGYSGDGGPADAAQLFSPGGLFFDAADNLYIADAGNNVIREVNAQTQVITTVVGNYNGGKPGYFGDGGDALSALLNTPQSVLLDSSGNIYIADSQNEVVRRVDAQTQIITTIAGTGVKFDPNIGFLYNGDSGLGTNVDLYEPGGLALDGSGNLYIADTHNSVIRRLDTKTLTLTTAAGLYNGGFSGDGGPAGAALLGFPFGLLLDASGHLLIADSENNRIRSVDLNTNPAQFPFTPVGQSSTTHTLVAHFNSAVTFGSILITAQGVANQDFQATANDTGSTLCAVGVAYAIGDTCTVDVTFSPTAPGPRTGQLMLVDQFRSSLGTVQLSGTGTGASVTYPPGMINTVAGTPDTTLSTSPNYSGMGGPATSAVIIPPQGVAVDGSGNLFIDDFFRVDPQTKIITLVGDPSAALRGGPLFVVDAGGNIVGPGSQGYRRWDLTLHQSTNIPYAIPPASGTTSYPPVPPILSILGLAQDSLGNLYFSDEYANLVYKVDIQSNVLTVVAGKYDSTRYPHQTVVFSGDGGPATEAYLTNPYGVAVDSIGNIYISDSGNAAIRKVDALTRIITTIAGRGTGGSGNHGDGGPATDAILDYPGYLAVDAADNLYIADSTVVRRIDKNTQIITKVAGVYGSSVPNNFSGEGVPPTSATFGSVDGIAFDKYGDLYIADQEDAVVRKVTLSHPPSLQFGTVADGSVSAPQSVSILNIGNEALTAIGPGLTISTNFTQVAGSGTPEDCTSTFSVTPNTSCNLSLEFSPTTAIGPVTGSVVLTDNAANSLQTIQLAGEGTAAGGPSKFAFSGFSATSTVGVQLTFTLTALGANNATLTNYTGTVTFTSSDARAVLPASYTFTAADAGVHTFSATFNSQGPQSITASDAAHNVVTVGPLIPVDKATPVITWPTPAPILYGTPLGVLQLNATASVPGTFAYTPAAGTILSVGTPTLSVTFTPTDTADYVATSSSVSLTITKATPTLGWPTPAPIAYGTPLTGAQLNATSAVSGAITYTPPAGAIPPVGTDTLTASFVPADTADYNSTTQTVQLVVQASPLTITVANASRQYGLANPAFTGTIAGVLNGDSVTANYTTTATASSPAGTYPISATLTGAAAANYTVTVVPGVLTITDAPLTITANSTNRAYGAPNPAFTGAITGQQNSDVLSLSFSTTATPVSPVGTYVIVPSVSGTNLASYTVSAVNGVLTIAQASTTITLAASAAHAYPGVDVTLTAVISPFATGTPTGTVTFFDGSTLLGTATVSSGMASYDAVFSTVATHSITAVYGGDTNFTSSTSAPVTETIDPPGYTIAANPTTLTVARGSSGTVTLTLTPFGDYAGTVSFDCSGLPSYASCAFAPAVVTFDGKNTVQTEVLTLNTQAAMAKLRTPNPGGGSGASLPTLPALAFVPGGLFVVFTVARRRLSTSRKSWVLILLLLLPITLGAIACGAHSPTPPASAVTDTVTITATAAAGSGSNQTVSIAITITP